MPADAPIPAGGRINRERMRFVPMNVAAASKKKKRGLLESVALELRRRGRLYLMLVIPVAYIILFCYVPMSGVLIAFEDYSLRKGVWGSPWVGLKHFREFFTTPVFKQLMLNTLSLSIYGFVAGFPAPIILALALNECKRPRFKKTVQMVTYAPYFISTVVMVSIIIQFLHVRTGMVNNFIKLLGFEPYDFMGNPDAFRSIYVWSGVWQGVGYSAVIYLAALAGIDLSLQEAAIIDGANRFQRVYHVDLPSILPTIVIQMILSLGSLLSVGYEKVYLMQNSLNMSQSEIISTYVYKRGLQDIQYSYSTAVGLFNSVVKLILICSANAIARRVNDTSLW